MTDEEKATAAAYIKLQDDVRQLIIDTVSSALEVRDPQLTRHVRDISVFAPELVNRIKDVIKDQMSKY